MKWIFRGECKLLAAGGIVFARMLVFCILWISTASFVAEASPSADVQGEDLVAKGHRLFLMNCAHCHAQDATGDEGPDLHGVKKSDTRIAAMIKNGVKGEMPKFGSKLNDADVSALITFIRSLK